MVPEVTRVSEGDRKGRPYYTTQAPLKPIRRHSRPSASSEEKRTGKTRSVRGSRRGGSGVDAGWGRLRRPGRRGMALVGRGRGRRKRPHPRPYGYEGASEAMS